jgi:hypothetical protein
MFQRIVVFLDHLAPDQGAFARALDWASCFRLSIQALLPRATCRLGGGQAQLEGKARSERDAAVVESCAMVCRDRHVALEVAYRHESLARDGPFSLVPSDLLVLGARMTAAEKKRWLRWPMRDRGPAVLFCPDVHEPWSRVLVVDDNRPHHQEFLTASVELGRLCQAKPVILTVARSEKAAWQRQLETQQALADRGLSCDHDIIVGAEMRTAVAQVAQWRRCQGIIVERQAAPPWWHWWQSGTTEKLVGLTNAFSFLALPRTDGLASSLTSSLPAPCVSRELSPRPF